MTAPVAVRVSPERIDRVMIFRSVLLALFLGFSTLACAKEPLPVDHAEQVFNLWLAAFNSGERDGLQAFLTEYKIGEDPQRYLDIRASLGVFKLLGVRSSTVDKVEVMLLSEMTDRGVLATLDMDPFDRLDVKKLQLEGMDLPDEFKPKRMRLAQALAAGRARLLMRLVPPTACPALWWWQRRARC